MNRDNSNNSNLPLKPNSLHPSSSHSSLPNPIHPTMDSSTARPPPVLSSYSSQRRYSAPTPVLLSHPDDNPGPWTRRSASWSRAEDERLAQLVHLEESNTPSSTPTKMWSRVASQLHGRTGKQCRERWLNQLKPGIRRGQWTDEEELVLRSAHEELGNKWVAIAQRLPGRTDNCVKNHWNSMLRKRQRREAAMRSAESAARNRPGPSRTANFPLSNILVPPEVNSDLARRASAMAEGGRLPQMPPTNFYDMVHATNPGTFDNLSRGADSSSHSLTSPITPQRNSKIQIANLVQPHRTKTASSSQPDILGVGFNNSSFGFDSHALGGDRNGGMIRNEGGLMGKPHTMLRPPIQTPSPGGFIFPDPSGMPPPTSDTTPLSHLTSGLLPFVRKDETHGTYGNGYLSTMSPVTTPVAGIGPSYPTLDQRMWNNNPFGLGEQHMSCRMNAGESSDMTNSADRTERSKSPAFRGYGEPKGSSRLGTVKSISKNGVRKGGNGASLAALAQVASSVPPSPLTPESRFSCTSRSTSPSPSSAQTGERVDGMPRRSDRRVVRQLGKGSGRDGKDR